MRFANLKSTATNFLDRYKNENPASLAAAQQAVGGLLILDGFVGIDNPFGGKKRSGIFGSLIGIVLGLLFTFGNGFVANLLGINKMTATTSATVTSVSRETDTTTTNGETNTTTSCTATAAYNVNGQQYNQRASNGSSAACNLTEGQTVQINYDPNSPNSWSTSSDLATLKTVLKVFSVAGIFIAIASLITFVIRLLSIIFGWKLLKSGRALARTLPEGTNLSSIIPEIKQSFSELVFGIQSSPPPNKAGVSAAPSIATTEAPRVETPQKTPVTSQQPSNTDQRQ